MDFGVRVIIHYEKNFLFALPSISTSTETVEAEIFLGKALRPVRQHPTLASAAKPLWYSLPLRPLVAKVKWRAEEIVNHVIGPITMSLLTLFKDRKSLV